MKKKNYLNFLIFYVCLPLGIFSKENMKKLSDLHVREKRLINTTPHTRTTITITKIRYIVSVHENGSHVCGGSILSSDFIVTAGHCVDRYVKEMYSIRSGSSYVNLGEYHNISRILLHTNYSADNHPYDLALVKINPPIDLKHSPNRKISLYNGYIPPNTEGAVSGWGCVEIKRNNFMVFPKQLRSITLSIVSESSCRSRYLPYNILITNKDICTFDETGRKKCSVGDSGNPLVVHDKLAGIFSVSENYGSEIYDVFVNLSHPEYRDWIYQAMKEDSEKIIKPGMRNPDYWPYPYTVH